jgi:hypothetical protein
MIRAEWKKRARRGWKNGIDIEGEGERRNKKRKNKRVMISHDPSISNSW